MNLVCNTAALPAPPQRETGRGVPMPYSHLSRSSLIRGFGPHERLGLFVVDVEVALDGRLEAAGTAVYAAAQLLLGEGGEAVFHLVEPRHPPPGHMR